MPTTLNRITILYMILNLNFQFNMSRNYPYLPRNFTMRVYQGTPVELGEVPYQIAFKQKDAHDRRLYFTFCGGAIIGDDKILSAAHCFVVETSRLFTFCLGGTYLDNMSDKFAVAGTLRNKNYERTQTEQWRNIVRVIYPAEYRFPIDDLAIVFIKTPFYFNKYVQPIKYAKKFEDYEGFCLVSGYGRISTTITSDSLLKAYLLLLSDRWCSNMQSRDMSDSICTSLVGADIGRGDSGGPLVCVKTGARTYDNESDILVGIASGTYPGLHSIFVRVSAYRKFIQNNRCTKSSSVCYVVYCQIILVYSVFIYLSFIE